MGATSNGARLVKLFVKSTARDRLVAWFGPIDCEFNGYLSFERLIQSEQLADIQQQTVGIVDTVGYLDNRKVVLAPDPHFYHSPDMDPFILQVRPIYRSQLRTMCILNREETT